MHQSTHMALFMPCCGSALTPTAPTLTPTTLPTPLSGPTQVSDWIDRHRFSTVAAGWKNYVPSFAGSVASATADEGAERLLGTTTATTTGGVGEVVGSGYQSHWWQLGQPAAAIEPTAMGVSAGDASAATVGVGSGSSSVPASGSASASGASLGAGARSVVPPPAAALASTPEPLASVLPEPSAVPPPQLLSAVPPVVVEAPAAPPPPDVPPPQQLASESLRVRGTRGGVTGAAVAEAAVRTQERAVESDAAVPPATSNEV